MRHRGRGDITVHIPATEENPSTTIDLRDVQLLIEDNRDERKTMDGHPVNIKDGSLSIRVLAGWEVPQ